MVLDHGSARRVESIWQMTVQESGSQQYWMHHNSIVAMEDSVREQYNCDCISSYYWYMVTWTNDPNTEGAP